MSEDDRLIVYLFSQSEELTKVTAQRIHEALQFVLVDINPWDILLIQKNNFQETIFRTVPQSLKKSRVQPPLHFNTVERNGDVWKLFELFLRHSLSYQNDDGYKINMCNSNSNDNWNCDRHCCFNAHNEFEFPYHLSKCFSFYHLFTTSHDRNEIIY